MENGKAFWTYGFSGFSSPVTTSPTPIRRDDSPLKAAAASSIQMAPASPLSKRTVLSPLTKAQVSGNVPDTVNESSPIPPQPIFLRKATTIKAVDRENDSENVPPSKEVKDSAMDVDMDSEMSYFSHRKGSVSSSDEDEATTPTPSSYSSPFGAAQSSALNKIRGMEVCQVSNASEVTSNDKWTPYEGFINPAHFN